MGLDDFGLVAIVLPVFFFRKKITYVTESEIVLFQRSTAIFKL